MPCHDEEKKALQKIIDGIMQGEPEAFKGERDATFARLRKLQEWDLEHPHIHLVNRDGEFIAIYFKSAEELEAFKKVYLVENARRTVEGTIQKKFAKKKEVER